MNTSIVELHKHGYRIVLGGREVAALKVPSDYVPLTFAPILGHHQLITGDLLVEGLIVVIEDSTVRGNPNDLSPENPERARGFVPSEYDRARLEENARWAIVTNPQRDGSIITFDAIYSDGTIRTRRYNKSYRWVVLSQFEMLEVCSECGTAHLPEEQPHVDESTTEPSSFADILDTIFGGVFAEDGVKNDIATSFLEGILENQESRSDESPETVDEPSIEELDQIIRDFTSVFFGKEMGFDDTKEWLTDKFADFFEVLFARFDEEEATEKEASSNSATEIVSDEDQAIQPDSTFVSNVTFAGDSETPTNKLSSEDELAQLRAKLRGELFTPTN
jgi:hypothetical protein